MNGQSRSRAPATLLKSLARALVRTASRMLWRQKYHGSERYWVARYARGGTSGLGSYGKLAEFKGEIINAFIDEKRLRSVIEYGCGDGNQLTYARYGDYLGFDVSPEALSQCKKAFADDPTKKFKLMQDYEGERAAITLSLDVIYHLTEDDVFEEYMRRLFDSSDQYVLIYSTDADVPSAPTSHVRHRSVTTWVEQHRAHWKLVRHVPNRYRDSWGAFADGPSPDFFIYEML